MTKRNKNRNVYLNKKLEEISHTEWVAFSKNRKYTMIAEYENPKIKLKALWVGKCSDSAIIPAAHRKPFRILVLNNTGSTDNPKWCNDPSSRKDFRTEADLMDFYNDFLITWTKSYVDEDGEFYIEDNLIAPPPPADMPTPTTVEVGSW